MAQGFNPAYIGPRDDILQLVPDTVRRVLDVGCSIGALGEGIKRKHPCASVDGIEYDEAMAAEAKKRLDRVWIGDAQEVLPRVEDGKYDCIVCADVLEHLRDPWGILKACRSKLAAGGIMIASIPNVRHWSTIYSLAVKGYWPYRYYGIHDRTHLRFFTRKNIEELFRGSGYSLTRVLNKYRITEDDRPRWLRRWTKCCRYLPGRQFWVFQYLIVAEVDGSHDPASVG
jgi:2-polyprenyl-3-methyl-5-hydroxy-6-metoxy-1,4-benzoquinol methylase